MVLINELSNCIKRDLKPRNTNMARGIVALSAEWQLCASEEDLTAAAMETRARGRGKEDARNKH